jgi:L-iditol 2-dehydrogenase
MKAVVLTGIREMEIADVPRPEIKNDTDVLLKIEMVGVCGSDVHYYETGKIGSQVVQYPYMVGHECAATVEAVGAKVTKIKAGDKIVVDPAISCYGCDQCNAGRENTCRDLKFLGCPGQVDGCLCEYIVMPEASCYPSGDKLTLAQAVLCEPVAIGVYAVQQGGVEQSSDIAVLGAGPIGLSCLVAAKAKQVRAAFATEKIEARMKMAQTAGAVWVGNPDREDIAKEILSQKPQGVDVVFECAGQQETIDEAIEILKPGGKLMLIGIPRSDRVSFSIDKMRRKEITVVNVRRQNECTDECIELISAGKIDVDFMVTHNFKFEQAKEAFDLVAAYDDGVVKAMIEF